jgi:hypothetical protein
MADYYSTVIVQPNIPTRDLTASELLLLSRIFDAEICGDALYLSSSTGPSDLPEFQLAAVRAALDKDSGQPSQAADWLQNSLAENVDDEEWLEIDMSTKSFEFVLQDIVQRSASINYITVVTSFRCSKMRPDGFGGAAVLICADKILGKSTDDVINDFLGEVDPRGEWQGERVK